jgi:hypothetical protein
MAGDDLLQTITITTEGADEAVQAFERGCNWDAITS